jgi:LysM repeat protein/chaperonin cofactor prefoldin
MKSLSCLISISLMVLIFSACNVNPERSDAFIKLSKRVEELEKSYKGAQTDLSDLYEQLNQVRKSLETAPAAGAGAGGVTTDPAAVTAAVQRLEQLEKKVALLENQMTLQQKGAPAKTPAKPAEKAVEPAAAPGTDLQPPTAPDASTVVPKPAAPAADKTGAKKPDAKKPAEKAGEKAAAASSAKGSYYTIQSGDTLETIASKNGVTVQQLKDENHLTNGAKLMGGQQIFIPKK